MIKRTLDEQIAAIEGLTDALCDLFSVCGEVMNAAVASKETNLPISPDWLIDTVLGATVEAQRTLGAAGLKV